MSTNKQSRRGRPDGPMPDKETLKDTFRSYGTFTDTAKELGISRPTLNKAIRFYGLKMVLEG